MCKRILLDVDGVVADFTGGMMVAHNQPWPYSRVVGDAAWRIDEIWGLSKDEFWKPCGYSFWRTLEKMPEADEIVDACVRHVGRQGVCFCTSPCQTKGSMDGKLDWLSDNYPGFPVLFTVGDPDAPPKQFCAGRDAILIDDCSRNVDNFVAWGGAGFLVARSWNRSHRRERHILEDLNDFLYEDVFC